MPSDVKRSEGYVREVAVDTPAYVHELEHEVETLRARVTALETEKTHLVAEVERTVASVALPHEEQLTACIPLRLEGVVTGVIAIYRLLPQKSALSRVDRELLELLATHAAAALHCSALHDRFTTRGRDVERS